MKLDVYIQILTKKLSDNGIATARLDLLILLEDLTRKDRGWLLAHPEFGLTPVQDKQLTKQVKQRIAHVPLAYIRGKSEFYGREYIVTPDTLQPRPETETIISLLKVTLKNEERRAQGVGTNSKVGPWKIVDVGTGSGCIAITAKLELPESEVYATEINDAALKIAKQNAKKLQADVTFFKGNLLEPFSKLQDPSSKIAHIILANLPYVPNNHTINESALQEPSIAIFGGKDGLDLYREMFNQINSKEHKPQYILTESLPFQHASLAKIAKKNNYTLTTTEDFIQVFTIYN